MDQPVIDLAEFLKNQPQLDFQLPSPEDEEISDLEFQQQLESAWQVCDRFDLQTDIWRGRILRTIRDREKKGGEGRGKGFLNWLKQRDITKSQAYALIQLANSADTLLSEGNMDPEAINNFSKRAFVETAKSDPEVQQLVTDAAQRGDRITRREVRQLADEWTAMSSDLLPAEVKEQATTGSLPTRHLAPLVKELEKLPESHLHAIKSEVAEHPDVDTVKQMTSEARNLAKYLDAAAQVQALNDAPVDMEMALEEALRLGCLNTASDLVKQATQLEQTIVKLYTTWKRLGNLADRVYVETGASTPHLRSLLVSLGILTGEVMQVPLSDFSGTVGGDRTVRLQILSDSPRTLDRL
ncbi:MAG: hypothetical protein GDA43_08600 [Hormoscilla sp. SP5CHS1]|nr:hypothetical protein [Hormoscilla sp. SP5CHS1]